MDDGSSHDPGRAPEGEPALEDERQPGWFARAWARMRRAWRWVRRKHEPIAEGIETAGRGWARAARTAAWIGRSLARMGTVIERNGTSLAEGRGRSRRIGRNLIGFGAGLNGFGVWLVKTGRRWAPLGDDIEDIGEHLGALDIAPLPAEEPAEPLLPAEPVRPLSPPPQSLKTPPAPEPPRASPEPDRRPGPTPQPRPSPRPKKVRDEAVRKAPRSRRPGPARESESVTAATEDLPTEVRQAIANLGKRPRSDRLRAVIEAICRSREWTTVKELSGFLGMSEKTLRSRHLPPMLKAGRLVRRYPNRPRHRGQKYGAPEPGSG